MNWYSIHFILNSTWRNYEPTLYENAEKVNTLDKSNERKIMDGLIADIKSKRDMQNT